MGSERAQRVVKAAGGVVWREGAEQHAGREAREVLVVHRPRYDDWSLPKGKAHVGEPAPVTAVREIAEETAVRVRLGPELRPMAYRLADGARKEVRFWTAEAVASERFEPNDEVDEIAWIDLAEARRRLREAEVGLVRTVVRSARPSRPVVVVRHAVAMRRKDWKHDDPDRPLTVEGDQQARELATLLAAWAPERLVSSPSRRCRDTVAPLAASTGLPLELEPALSEEAYESSPKAARALLRDLVADARPVVVCTHRPLLADAARVVGLDLPRSARQNPLPKGALWVSHDPGAGRVERYSP